jgi:hypothetical protein
MQEIKKYKQVIYERNYLMIEITMLGRGKVDKVHTKKKTTKNRIIGLEIRMMEQ